jgi:hypothetical protein
MAHGEWHEDFDLIYIFLNKAYCVLSQNPLQLPDMTMKHSIINISGVKVLLHFFLF